MSSGALARVGAIDGLRAVAVGAVVVYHLVPAWLPSGFLGVDVFMVVSGFLITGLLARERGDRGRVRLAAFWARRARRLLPAALLLVLTVAVVVRLTGPNTLDASTRAHGLAAMFYVTNWRLIADGTTYGGAVSGESPLLHLWSLAVEEQFYVLWPLALVVVLAVSRGRRWPLVVVAGAGAMASAAWMAARYEPGQDPLRIYYGTDTRAQAFLIGALASFLTAPLRATVRRARLLSRAGAAALGAVIVVMVCDAPGFLYNGGFLLVALASGIVIVAATVPGPVSNLLDQAPLRVIGRVSYGIYLWHWPAIVLLTPDRTGLSGPALAGTRLVVTAVGAAVSWVLVEQPMRRAGSPRFVLGSGAAACLAVVTLSALPAQPLVAFASYRTGHVPEPIVVQPHATAVAITDEPVAEPAAPSGGMSIETAGTAMIVGDSGMLSATPALSAGLQAAGWTVVETAYPGIGLTQPEGTIDGWREIVREHGVDLTIVMIGGWDVGWVRDHGDDAYRAVLGSAVASFTDAGGRVLWLSVLPGGIADDRASEHLFAELPERFPDSVDYLDIEGSLRAPEGGWPQVVDGRRLRGPDGWHLCPDGAASVSHAVLDRLSIDSPGWDAGPWRADPAYHDPPGVCD